MKKKSIAFALVFVNIVFAADTVFLSLDDALTRALRDNILVRIERINTNIAASLLKENYYAYEPQIKVSYKTSEPFDSSNEISLSVTQAAVSGTGIEFWANASPLNPSAKQAAPDGSEYENSIGVTITQALLRGGYPSANLVPIRKARIDVEMREEELAAYAQKLLSDTERAYWNLKLSGEEVKIYQYSLDLAQRFLYESQERLKIGSVAAIDLAAITAEAASRERQLFDAVSAYRQKLLYLVYLMNAPQYWDAEIILTDTVVSLGEADGVEEHIEASKKFRQDFRQANLSAKKGELDLVATKNGLLPKLDFFISLQGTSYAESFSNPLSPDERKSQISGGLTLQFPALLGSSRQKNNIAKYSLQQQKLSLENFLRLLEYEIRAAHIEALRAFRQIETAKTVSALQQQKLDAEQERMNVGKSTGYAVLQVQRDLVSANLDEARARIAYIEALLSLYSKDATLLQRRGVAVNSVGE